MPKMWLLLLAGGCHRSYPLSEVPIVGGSEEARLIVEEELALFSEAIYPETIELSEIAFEEMKGEDEGFGGWYRDRDRRIQIGVGLSVEDISWAVRHELCHALDYQAELADKPHEVLDAYAERMYNPELGGFPWKDDPRLRRSEAVARACEVGPTIAAAVAHPCPGESPLLVDLASYALTKVWRGVSEGPIPLPVEQPVTFAALEPFAYFSLTPTNDPDLLQLRTFDADHFETTYTLDLRSGEQVEPGPDLVSVHDDVEAVPEAWALEKTVPFAATGGPDQALVAVIFDIEAFYYHLPDYPRERLLWSAGDGWSAVPLCLPGSWMENETDPVRWDIFTAQDELWYAEGDGQKVWWSPVIDQSR